jgi:hypothetical protein
LIVLPEKKITAQISSVKGFAAQITADQCDELLPPLRGADGGQRLTSSVYPSSVAGSARLLMLVSGELQKQPPNASPHCGAMFPATEKREPRGSSRDND